jgi:hypothetical protein
MPQAANIAINDSVPVLQTYKPKAVGDLALFQDDTAISIAGRPEIKVSHRPATATAVGRTRLTMKVPVEEDVDGVNTVTRESTVVIDVLTSPDSTLQERKDLRVLASNLLLDDSIIAVVEGGEKVW